MRRQVQAKWETRLRRLVRRRAGAERLPGAAVHGQARVQELLASLHDESMESCMSRMRLDFVNLHLRILDRGRVAQHGHEELLGRTA